MGQGARARALEARGAAGRDHDRRGGQRLGRPAGRAGGLRDRGLARRLRPGRRLARRRARAVRRARGAARARRREAARRPALRRLGRRGGRALRAQPVRLVRLRGDARDRRGPRPQGPRRRAARGRRRPTTTSTSRRSTSRARSCRARGRTSSCTSSRARCSRAATSRRRPCSARSGSSAAPRCSAGAPSHAGATPMDMRQDSFLAAARAALDIREVGLAHEGGYCTTGGASSEPGVVTAVAGRTELLLDQRHLDADELAAMLDGGRRGVRARGRGVRLHGRGQAPVVDPADPVRRAADRLRQGGARHGHGDPARARCTTPPRWRG